MRLISPDKSVSHRVHYIGPHLTVQIKVVCPLRFVCNWLGSMNSSSEQIRHKVYFFYPVIFLQEVIVVRFCFCVEDYYVCRVYSLECRCLINNSI